MIDDEIATPGTRPHHQRIVKLLVLALASFYAGWFSVFTCIQHDRFRTGAFDLGTFDQGIWLAGHGTDYFVTVRGLHLLGDHVRLFSFVLAPLYWVWDDVRALLVLQSFTIAAGAWFLCRITLRELPNLPWCALVISASYLLNPAVQNLNLEHAHPDAFASTLILASIEFLCTGRNLAFALAAALATSCKEDVPLVFVAMGAVMIWDRRTRMTGFVVTLASAMYFALATAFILPRFNGRGLFRIGKFGFWAGLWYRGHDPHWLLERLFNFESARYLYEIGLPQLYLFLLSPFAFAPAIPAVFINLLSDARYTRELEFHYQTSVVPFLYVGTIYSLAKLSGARTRHAPYWTTSADVPALRGSVRESRLLPGAAVAALVVAALISNLYWSRVPVTNPGLLQTNWEEMNSDPEVAAIGALLTRVPKGAAISADYSLVPHLSHRRRVYVFPNPFVARNWGIHNENPHDPRAVRFIAVRRAILTPEYIAMLDGLVSDGAFVRVAGNDDVGLYQREAGH